MKALTVAAMLFGGMATAHAEIIDLSDYYPGPLATTHMLRATDGRYYRFSGDIKNGLWSRSIDPGCADYHLWAPDGMYYLGWECPGQLHWAVPPELFLPRQWDPATTWTRTFPYILANRSSAGNTFTSIGATVTIQRVVENGETLFIVSGGSPDGMEWETWWISPCLPVRGGGCSPGFRGYYMISGGVLTGSGEFVEWVPLH